jgi:hypothetical protein
MSNCVSSIIESLAAAGKAYEQNEADSRKTLIDLGVALVAQLEIPSEFLQRTFWAEVSLYNPYACDLASACIWRTPKCPLLPLL